MVQLEPNSQNGLEKASAADAFQIRSVFKERLVKKLGQISDDEMNQIARAMAIVLSIEF